MALKEALIKGGTGAAMGAASGTPHGIALGGAAGFIDGLFSSGGGGKNHAAIRAKKVQKQNLKIHEFQKGENARTYEYNVEGLAIREKNDNANIDYQEESNNQNWIFETSKQKYAFDQANRARDESIETKNKQLGFNKQAKIFGLEQQERYKEEQLQSLKFDKEQLLLNYSIASIGLELDKAELKQDIGAKRALVNQGYLAGNRNLDQKFNEDDQEIAFKSAQTDQEFRKEKANLASEKSELGVQNRQAMSTAQNKTQQSLVAGLEARGKAQASGSGRSATKAMQAAIAKAGANETSIADELMFGLQKIDISIDKIGQKSAAMRAQLSLDKLILRESKANLDLAFGLDKLDLEEKYDIKIEDLGAKLTLGKDRIAQGKLDLKSKKTLGLDMFKESKQSLKDKNKAAKEQIRFDKSVADAAAKASVHLKPEMSPPIPEPIALPRPEYQDVYKPKDPPKPKKHTVYQPGVGQGNQYLSQLASLVGPVSSLFKGGGNQPNMQTEGAPFTSGAGYDSAFTSEVPFNSFGEVDFSYGSDFGGFDLGLGDMSLSGIDYTSDFADLGSLY